MATLVSGRMHQRAPEHPQQLRKHSGQRAETEDQRTSQPMQLTFLAKKEGKLQPMMKLSNCSLEEGCRKFNKLSGYEIFWVLIDDELMQKAVPHGDSGWRLIDDVSTDLL